MPDGAGENDFAKFAFVEDFRFGSLVMSAAALLCAGLNDFAILFGDG